MKERDPKHARKRPEKPKDAKVARPAARKKALAEPSDRSAALSKKLQSLQIRIPESERPVYQIQQFPEIIRYIREVALPEHQKHFDTPPESAVRQKLAAYLTEPVNPCLSFHFPLPEAAIRIVKDCHDWDQIQDAMFEWATQELDAIATEYIDVENLSEMCRACIGFTRYCFADDHADEHIYDDKKIGISWRNVGQQVAIIYAWFRSRRKLVKTEMWEVPQHEISDLFNRSLPQDLTMVYFSNNGNSNGLYVLMKTADIVRIDSFY
jgi:hypothetical protein